MLRPTREQAERVITEKGYAYFKSGDYNLNIIGVRHPESEHFDDLVMLHYKINGNWETKTYKATTDPGRHYLRNPLNRRGTAILKPGQYRSAYTIGKHQGRYTALAQRGAEVTVIRDKDRDYRMSLEESIEETGFFGINIHRAFRGKEGFDVGKWSAGCTVIANPDDFNELIDIARKSTSIYGPKLSYTLLEEKDFS